MVNALIRERNPLLDPQGTADLRERITRRRQMGTIPGYTLVRFWDTDRGTLLRSPQSFIGIPRIGEAVGSGPNVYLRVVPGASQESDRIEKRPVDSDGRPERYYASGGDLNTGVFKHFELHRFRRRWFGLGPVIIDPKEAHVTWESDPV